jgi:hypothetical protein
MRRVTVHLYSKGVSAMRSYFVPGAAILCLSFFASWSFGHQSTPSGTPLSLAEASTTWGGQQECVSAYIFLPNGACTTHGPSSCAYDGPDYGCRNQCAAQCSTQGDWNAGGCCNGYIYPGSPCPNFSQQTCQSTGGDNCACGSPYVQYPCQSTPWLLNPCNTE